MVAQQHLAKNWAAAATERAEHLYERATRHGAAVDGDIDPRDLRIVREHTSEKSGRKVDAKRKLTPRAYRRCHRVIGKAAYLNSGASEWMRCSVRMKSGSAEDLSANEPQFVADGRGEMRLVIIVVLLSVTPGISVGFFFGSRLPTNSDASVILANTRLSGSGMVTNL
jgi:hypothetical protein